MNSPVVRQPADRHFDDFELPGVNGQVIKKDRVENDPADRQKSVGGTVDGRGGGGRDWHTVDDDGNGERGSQAGQGGEVCAPFQDPERDEQQDNRKRRGGCAQPRVPERIVNLNP